MHPPSDDPRYFNRPINLDISNKCRLQCEGCDRQLNPSMTKRARDISLESYGKIIDKFNDVLLCGQQSDPIYHPKFHEILRMSKDLNCLGVATNGSGKRDSWWEESFEIGIDNGNTIWKFALDGLPNESHIYRKNQDGNAVWEVMKRGRAMGADIVWQYLVFSYNEDHIEEAISMAKSEGIRINIKKTARHPKGLKPRNPKYFVTKDYSIV